MFGMDNGMGQLSTASLTRLDKDYGSLNRRI
jgi:hypothetical protein